jgi:hypothetical protein
MNAMADTVLCLEGTGRWLAALPEVRMQRPDKADPGRYPEKQGCFQQASFLTGMWHGWCFTSGHGNHGMERTLA